MNFMIMFNVSTYFFSVFFMEVELMSRSRLSKLWRNIVEVLLMSQIFSLQRRFRLGI